MSAKYLSMYQLPRRGKNVNAKQGDVIDITLEHSGTGETKNVEALVAKVEFDNFGDRKGYWIVPLSGLNIIYYCTPLHKCVAILKFLFYK